MKVSSVVGTVFGLTAVALFAMSFQSNPNTQILEAFIDVIKVLAGALAGAIAGEKVA